jgi:hypothetical protein
MARPMPFEAPVTTATCSVSFRSMMCVRPSGSGCPGQLVRDYVHPRAEDGSSPAIIGHAGPGDHRRPRQRDGDRRDRGETSMRPPSIARISP